MGKVTEKCGDTFGKNICTRKKGHGGKHLDECPDRGWHSWTDAGKHRVLAEYAAEYARRAEIEEAF
jgi:hypothetical protein